jgi:gluconolactonase
MQGYLCNIPGELPGEGKGRAELPVELSSCYRLIDVPRSVPVAAAGRPAKLIRRLDFTRDAFTSNFHQEVREMLRRTLLLACSLVAVADFAPAAEPISGLGPSGEVKKVHGDLQFTEGPAWDGRGLLYFTDIPANRIYKTDGQNLEVFVEPSGHCNGLMFDARGTLYACSMDGAIVSFDTRSGERTVLAESYEGQRFNAPNDLVIDQQGGIYFTDPRFRAPMPLPQGEEAVYYLDANRRVTRLRTGLDDKAPNGVILSPDEKTLYIVSSMTADVMAYPVERPGVIGEGRVFAKLKQREGGSGTGPGSGGDGLTLDTKGNLYITSAIGLQVFSPEGELLGVIEIPEQPANVTFGGRDRKTLYVTARTGLYSVPMEAEGHVFPGRGR